MSKTNDYGVSRYIDAETAREVRKKSGFGCLFCGCAIIEYDHFDPEFKDVKQKHDPNGIVALCGTHHRARGNGHISIKQIKEKLKELNTDSIISNYKFELERYPEIQVGSTRIIGVRKIIEIDGEDILSYSPPESIGAPPLLSASFYNKNGKLMAEIIDNEWRGYSQNWDIEVSGNTFKVRRDKSKIALEVELKEGKVHLKRLKMKFNETNILIENNITTVESIGRTGSKLIIPNVPTITKDWLHWIKVSNKSITWCTENIHELLNDVPSNRLPLSECDQLKFGAIKTVIAIPKSVKPTKDPQDPNCEWVQVKNGEFEKITLNQLGLCPHSHPGKSTMYLLESKNSSSSITMPFHASLKWAKLQEEADSYVIQNYRDIEKILKLYESARLSILEESGKVGQWVILTMKIADCYRALKDDINADKTKLEIERMAPQYTVDWERKTATLK